MLLATVVFALTFAVMATPADYSVGFVADYVGAPFSSLYPVIFAGRTPGR